MKKVLRHVLAAGLLAYFLAACAMQYEVVRADWGPGTSNPSTFVFGIKLRY